MPGVILPLPLLGAAIGGSAAFRRKGRRAGFVPMGITAVLSVLLCILAAMIELKKRNLIKARSGRLRKWPLLGSGSLMPLAMSQSGW